MVYASVYPTDGHSFDELRIAINRLILNDSSVNITQEHSAALGMGYRCGFLGLLHMEVFHQRLLDEQKINVMLTAPMVPYQVIDTSSKTTIHVEAVCDFPELHRYHRIREPIVEASIIVPVDYLGNTLDLLKDRRGIQKELEYLDDSSRVQLKYHVPWQEIVQEFHDDLKSITSGYAVMNYRNIGYQDADIVKTDILINGKTVDALSFIGPRSKAHVRGRAFCKRLKDVMKRQQYEINIQAAMGSKIFAKERIAPYRKDVLTKSGKTVGGGDVSRKQKLLSKQKEGKKRMKTVGNVQLSQEAFWSVLKKQ